MDRKEGASSLLLCSAPALSQLHLCAASINIYWTQQTRGVTFTLLLRKR